MERVQRSVFKSFLRRTHILSFIKLVQKYAFFALNIFYYPILRYYYLSKVKRVPRETQLFLVTRLDFGTYLFIVHYVRCWMIKRGRACIVILNPKGDLIKRLSNEICKNVSIISPGFLSNRFINTMFGVENVQFFSFNPLYCRIHCRWPHALYIYDQPIDLSLSESVSNYISYFDTNLSTASLCKVSERFLKSYSDVRQILDYRDNVYNDMVKLSSSLNDDEFYRANLESIESLKCCLNISRDYVILNINAKNYRNSNANARSVFCFKAYDSLIDFLISRDFDVVIQGRSDQPIFSPRKHLIDYSRSSFASIENDLILYSGCKFGVLSKTGAEVFGTVCNVPILGLNYVELCSMQPNQKLRFYPKKLWCKSKKRFLTWEEQLLSPSFFDISKRRYDPDIEYVDMADFEMIQAAEEFLMMTSSSIDVWGAYTDVQKKFKSLLTPLHMDLYRISGVPCNAYLSNMSG